MGKIAFLFPGQGSQSVGMGAELYQKSKAAKAIFDEADDALGEKLSELIFQGPRGALQRTENTQPAILTVSIAAYAALQEAGIPAPDFAAGHSLGEYSALVAAGTLPFADAVCAVRARGRFMQEAVPEGVGAMSAILGLDAARITEICLNRSTAESLVSVANYNGAAQTVIAGHKSAVESAGAALKEAGAKRVIPLPVSAPFHCELMAPVQPLLDEVLAEIAMQDAAFPIYTNVEAAPRLDASKTRDLLVQQVVRSVRFTEIAQALIDAGTEKFIEVGPGKVLIGMIKRMARGKTFLDVSSPAGVEKVKETL